MKATYWLVIVMVVTGGLLSACGQKGALYMPYDASQQEEMKK